MKRYFLHDGLIGESDNGEFVLYADVQKRIEALEVLSGYASHQKCCGWEIDDKGSPFLTDKCNCGLAAARVAVVRGG